MGTGVEPIIQIGKAGVVDAVVQQMDEALEARELIKIRVIANSPVEPREIASQLAEATRSEIVQIIGRNILYYRRSVKKPSFELPS